MEIKFSVNFVFLCKILWYTIGKHPLSLTCTKSSWEKEWRRDNERRSGKELMREEIFKDLKKDWWDKEWRRTDERRNEGWMMNEG